MTHFEILIYFLRSAPNGKNPLSAQGRFSKGQKTLLFIKGEPRAAII
jgi:hypothetical protein